MKIFIIIICAVVALYCGALTGFSSIIICSLIGGGIGIIYALISAKNTSGTPENPTAEATTLIEKEKKDDSTDTQKAQIEKYKKLKDEGVITQEEFDAKRKDILGL